METIQNASIDIPMDQWDDWEQAQKSTVMNAIMDAPAMAPLDVAKVVNNIANGPWSEAAKTEMVNVVLNKGTNHVEPPNGNKTQTVKYIEPYMTKTLVEAMRVRPAGLTFNKVDVFARWCVHLGLRCPSETTKGMLTATLIAAIYGAEMALNMPNTDKYELLTSVKELSLIHI